MNDDHLKNVVKKTYGEIAAQSRGCSRCGCHSNDDVKISKSIGYSDEEIASVSDANLGLGCGNPTALGEIKPGDVVLDLGSGAGFDCFLAAKKVGEQGRVIGVDMTEEMIQKAKANAEKYGYANVEFRLGEIEQLPVDDASVDVVISNCVINLVPDKPNAFKEAYRTLKPGGRMFVSDIILLAELTEAQRNNEGLVAGCVGGALLKDDYLNAIKGAGFDVTVLSEDKEISKRQYQGIPLESLKVQAVKTH